jgi:hypothetical protein
MVLTPGDRGLDREQGPPERAGRSGPSASISASTPYSAGRSSRPVTTGAASAAGSAVVRGDHGGLPERHLHPQGRRPGQGARPDSGDSKSEVSWICAELGRSGGVPDRSLAEQPSRYMFLDARGARSRGQGWPQATRQGLALTPARTPPHCCKPRIRSRSRRGLTVGVCRVHFLRNVLPQVPKGYADRVAAAIRTIFAQPDAATGRANLLSCVAPPWRITAIR